MSSLKDIMDVDVEPLESQAIQRSREIALQQSQAVDTRPRATQSPKAEPSKQPSNRTKRSNRVTRPPSSATASRPGSLRRRSSGATEFMDSSGYGQRVSPTGSPSYNMRPSLPRGIEADPTIRYTPVTGRISRAKKGQPVHIFDLCEEPIAFTIAEHLLRHQLSHQQARLPCTFQDCEKAFHRPDLLARHMNRHETQGEKPYKSGESGVRSRSSSTSSNPRTPPRRFSPSASNMRVPGSNFTSPSTQAPVGGSTSMRMEQEYEPIMGPFQPVSVSNSISSDQPPRNRTGGSNNLGPQLSGTTGSMSSESLGTSSNFRNIPMDSSMPSDFIINHQTTLGPAFEHSTYHNITSSVFESPTATQSLPLLTLQVPDQAFPPSLAQTNSPPYNSSESTWSTPSDVSRAGTNWPRDRALSVTGNPGGGWVDPMNSTPQFLNQNMHVLRQQPSLEIVPENFESPYMSQTRHYSSPMVLYQPVVDHGGVEDGRGDMYQDDSQSRGYPPSNVYGHYYQGL